MLSAAALEALAAVRPGRSETEVALEVELALRRAGFSKPAFETIVASGPQQRPASRPAGRPGPPTGDGVVLDFGGVYDGYCVDLTRTVQLAPATGPFRRIFDAVREAHAAAIAVVRPGRRPSAVDTAAREVLAGTAWREAFGARHRTWPRAGSARGAADHPAGSRRATEIRAAGHGLYRRAGRLSPGRRRGADRRRRAGDRDGCEVLTTRADRPGRGRSGIERRHRGLGEEPAGD